MTIVAAAVRYQPPKFYQDAPDYPPLIFTIPAPARHGDILIALSQLSTCASVEGEQGFIDDFGQFYTREEAMHSVKLLKQPTIETPGRALSDKLYSEDLW